MLSKKEDFIATNVVIATAVDTMRLIIYALSFWKLFTEIDLALLVIPFITAFLGIALGMILLKKVTVGFIQKVIVILLYVLGICLIIGII